MPLVGFEPTTSAGQLPQTYSFYRAATWTGFKRVYQHVFTTKRIRTVAEMCVKHAREVTFSQRGWMFDTGVSTDR